MCGPQGPGTLFPPASSLRGPAPTVSALQRGQGFLNSNVYESQGCFKMSGNFFLWKNK